MVVFARYYSSCAIWDGHKYETRDGKKILYPLVEGWFQELGRLEEAVAKSTKCIDDEETLEVAMFLPFVPACLECRWNFRAFPRT